MDLDRVNFESLGNLLVLYGLNILYAIGLIVVGWWLATFVERLVMRALGATRRVDVTVSGFLASIARYTVLVFVGVAVLQRFGIQTTSIIAVLGATSLAIGLALQGTLSNLAAGVMLLLFRPFKLGDSVEVAGVAGTVKGLSLFTTELASGTNVQVLIPNAKVWGSNIVNNSAYGQRQFAVTLELPGAADAEAALAEAVDFLKADTRVLSSPGPSASVSKMLLDRVEITVSAWTNTGDDGAVKAALTRHLRGQLRAAEASAA
ncbi:small conductance mechanosensitive channel [Ancylobacter sp. 3268]|uniref:mechanosensitive ion channel family protein n=1 Tax=Ancylobacter sp. 3268 TaxID=2817752 RepID=UPI00285E9B30|nr:mechanosensitive ion channel domain-containing protein [Ancylobacter sp. 3268]MDR6954317.1 small conductance mechanosensitive channel [Ancylobacter sp. 3268]